MNVNDLMAQLKAQPQKTAAMAVLIVVLIAVLCRAFRGPAAASAMSGVEVPVEAAADKDLRTAAHGTPACALTAVQAALTSSRARGSLPPRNIFALDPSYFPKPADAKGQDRSVNERVPNLDPRQAELAALREKVRTFCLRSTMTGSIPTAFIDETMVHEGDAYGGFMVRKIQDRKVTLEAKGHLFNLILSRE